MICDGIFENPITIRDPMSCLEVWRVLVGSSQLPTRVPWKNISSSFVMYSADTRASILGRNHTQRQIPSIMFSWVSRLSCCCFWQGANTDMGRDSVSGTFDQLFAIHPYTTQPTPISAFILLVKSPVTAELNIVCTLLKYRVQTSGVMSRISFQTALPRYRDNSRRSFWGTKWPLATTS